MKLIITPEQLETLTKENPNMTVLEFIETTLKINEI